MKFSKKFSVKIPKDIKIIYYTEQNFIVLIGPLGRKILKLKLKLFLAPNPLNNPRYVRFSVFSYRYSSFHPHRYRIFVKSLLV